MSIYKDIVEGYQLNNIQEKDKLNNVLVQLNEKDDQEMINRKNFIGHFTASAFVISKDNRRLLMVHHNILKRYLQPGGHIDKNDRNPLDAAKRELFEETGIDSEILTYQCAEPLNSLIPFNVSVHKIPENKLKNERSHYHYDLQYLFYIENEVDVKIDSNESSSYEWIQLDNVKDMDGYKEIIKKIEKLEAASQERFLSNMLKGASFEDISCITVQHIIPSTIPIIMTLQKIFGHRLLVCAKPNSVDKMVWHKLENMGVRLTLASRDEYFNVDYLGIKSKTILLDIGGYFASIAQIQNLPIECIIEDTENGIQKYENVIDQIEYPLFSVARNPLKKNEDYLVGADIVFGTDYILHQKNLLMQYMQVVCIGYGKIGYGICTKLRELGIRPKVLEKDSMRTIQAVRDGCDILLEKDFKNIDLIFCATGSKSLDILDFRSIKDGTFLVSATSSDDEFNYSYLLDEYEEIVETSLITRYESEDNYFYLLNQGTPTNFVVNSALGNYILLVQAAILYTAKKFIEDREMAIAKQVNTLSDEDNYNIAKQWLEEFC